MRALATGFGDVATPKLNDVVGLKRYAIAKRHSASVGWIWTRKDRLSLGVVGDYANTFY